MECIYKTYFQLKQNNMSMKRYSADSCSVQYFQPYQQYEYVPECLPECVPEYENLN